MKESSVILRCAVCVDNPVLHFLSARSRTTSYEQSHSQGRESEQPSYR
jgi:hypothetical protein